MRSFHVVLSPTVLYSSGTWIMTKAREHRLRSAHIHMLRTILGKGRTSLVQADDTFVASVIFQYERSIGKSCRVDSTSHGGSPRSYGTSTCPRLGGGAAMAEVEIVRPHLQAN